MLHEYDIRKQGPLIARIVVLCVSLVLAVGHASASSTDLFGMGARGASMGGAVVSSASGYSCVYYNPASLMVLGHRQFSVGYQRADFGLELNDADYEVDEVSNLLLGFNVPIPFGGVLADRFAVGFGFLVPFASVLEADVRAPETPVFIVVENRPRVIGVHAALSVKIVDWLYLGAGVVALAELVGGLDIAPNETGQLGTVVRDELIADYAPIVGIHVEPTEWLSFGLTFHGVSDARFTFPITADLGPEFPVEVPLLNIAGIAQYDPMNLSTDVSYRPLPNLLVAAGVTFKRWSAFKNPIRNTSPAVPEQDPAEFVDIWIPRIGAEYLMTLSEVSLAYRLGGFLEPSPVLLQVANHNYLDSDRFGLGLGLGVSWRGLTADLAVQLQFMRDREHIKEPDMVRDPENAGLPSISHGGNIIVSVLEMGLAF